MKNKEIRLKLWEKKIPLWKVAEKVGVTEVTICRWFRNELTGEKLARVQTAIDELLREGGEANG